MTTTEQIEEQIQKQDIEPYLNKVYDGFISEEIIEQFKIAMMFIPITAHKYSMKDVRTISGKRPDEITNRELGMVINMIYAVPFASMYATLEEGIEKTMSYDKIREEYNKNSAAFERKVQAKRKRLLSLSGVGNSHDLGNSGMKIISED